MRFVWLLVLAGVFGLPSCGLEGAEAPKFTQKPRGVMVETDRYRAEISSGVMTSFFNKLTAEEYIDSSVAMGEILPHLPSGLGTQNGPGAMAAAEELYHHPWWENPVDANWPNQHYPTEQSAFQYAANGAAGCVLTYSGLFNGTNRFADEVYTVEVAVDGATGDLLVTPTAKSPRPGVYAANFTVATLQPAITIEAPIFDGVQLDRHMPAYLWANAWPTFWDYALIALNGEKRGAVGVWAQDAQLKYYKHLFYRPANEHLSFSLSMMNVPPFDKLTGCKVLPWRFQAFDKGWPQVAARFRDWRLKNVKIAPRAKWTKEVSFVNSGINANKIWLDTLVAYFGGKHLDRTVTHASCIRIGQEWFDRNHANNTPYPGFRNDMKAWKPLGARLMAYLQPMIMWTPDPKTQRERDAVAFHKLADTHAPFGGKWPDVDQHHLGEPHWQRWFLEWVKEYIKSYGADGIYHDQAYYCPIDARGLAINNMTSPQGMADYFYKAQAENPGSIHGTEHMNEVNNVGASLGIGAGIHWGTAPSGMAQQRILHASPISDALHFPNGVIYAFPHMSEFRHGDIDKFHAGNTQQERRGDIPSVFLQNPSLYKGQVAPFSEWVNELWLDRVRSLTFVNYGLRPVFPEDWAKGVLSYFKGHAGEEFHYEQTPWGSAFVQVVNGKPVMQYGRVHGASEASEGGIAGWLVYNQHGPAGLSPDRWYCLDPHVQRPAVWFELEGEPASYVDEGVASDTFAFIGLRPLANAGNAGQETMVVHAAKAPAAILINGESLDVAKAARLGATGEWVIPVRAPANVVVFLKQLTPGFAQLKDQLACRCVLGGYADVFSQSWMKSRVSADGQELKVSPPDPGNNAKTIVYVAIKPSTDAKAGTLRVSGDGLADFAVDGNQDSPFGAGVPVKGDMPVLLTLRIARTATIAFSWTEGQK